MPERAPIIDCWLTTFRAPMSLQLRSAVLTMRKRRALSFAFAEKSSLARLRLFDRRDRRIAQDKFLQFIGHTSARLQKPFCEVYGLIRALMSKRVRDAVYLIAKFALTR